MIETPRTDAATDFTAPEKLRDCSATLEAELAAMTARAEHIGSSLAAVTAERDTLRREHNGCALWAEASRCQRDALKAELANATSAKELAERQVVVLAGTLASKINSYPCGSMAWSADQWAAWSREAAKGGPK